MPRLINFCNKKNLGSSKDHFLTFHVPIPQKVNQTLPMPNLEPPDLFLKARIWKPHARAPFRSMVSPKRWPGSCSANVSLRVPEILEPELVQNEKRVYVQMWSFWVAMSTISKRKRIKPSIAGKFLFRSETKVFINKWFIIEAKQAEVALDL